MSAHPKLHPNSERLASALLSRFGTVSTAALILGWCIFWIVWNSIAPDSLRFDPSPAFVIMLLICNIISLFLQPLMLISNNLQESANAKRAEELQAELDTVNEKLDQLLTRHPFH